MARRNILRNTLAAAAVAAASALPGTAAAREDVIARSATQAPDLAAGVMFDAFTMATVNNAGDVAFLGLLGGAGVSGSSDNAIYRGATLVAREGDAAPGLPAGVVFGPMLDFGAPPVVLNQAGQVAFRTYLAGTGVNATNEQAIYRDTVLAARTGDPVPFHLDTFLASLESVALNDAGRVLYRSTLTGPGVTNASNQALHTALPGGVVARMGNQAPGLPAGVQLDDMTFQGPPAFNNLGDVAFGSLLAGTGVDSSNDIAIFKNGALLARGGNPAPGLPAGVNFAGVGFVVLNEAGQAAFIAGLSGAGVDGTNNSAVYRDTTLVGRGGQPAPGLPAGVVLDDVANAAVALNDAGQVVFRATLVGSGMNSTNNTALYRDSTLIVRTGTPAPGQPGGVDIGSLGFGPYELNNAGQVVFHAGLVGSGVTFTNNDALYIGDGVELVPVVREGALLGDRLVSSFNDSGSRRLNDFGQVAYTATFADGTREVVLFTPDLRWRANGSGAWDTAARWTLSIDPAHVHDVRIDPSVSLTVTGPSSMREVRTLEIGGGGGIATLSLFGGTVSALSGTVQVLPNGVLTGEGTIGFSVRNRGTVRAQNLSVPGTLLNEGEIVGSGRINAVIDNSSGRIGVGAGETMRLGFVSNAAGGRIDVLGGELQLDAGMGNAGQLAARNAVLRFGAALSNAGQIAMSFGTSDVFGDVVNESAGKVLVSGASNVTFWDDVANAGEFRASSGSSIVYFGDVIGTGSFTGLGTHFFEGSVSPGASPGTLNVENSVFGPTNVLNIQLAGAKDGEYDVYNATGSLTLDGALAVTLLDFFAPRANDEFDILNWHTLSGRFDAISLPGLGFNLAWDTSDLYLDGTISVAAIPEPETYALLLAGLALLGFAARRKTGTYPI